MKTAIGDNYEDDEFLHPLWLGILILFTVIIVVGISCLVRKKFGSSILNFFNQLRCRNKSNQENQRKADKHSTIPNPYSLTARYVPRINLSPKLHTLVRNIQMASFEKQLSTQNTICDENECNESDNFSIAEEPDHVQTRLSENASQTNQEQNKNRNCETARKFYASMRQTSALKNSSSLESHDNVPAGLKPNNFMKSRRIDQFKIFRTPQFFQSITYGHE